jgi:outer membrane protein insertion porin family
MVAARNPEGLGNAAISLGYVRSLTLLLPLLVCPLAALAQDAGPEAWEGRTIVAIVRDPPQQPLEQGEFDRRLGLRIGAPLALADVRTAIDSLYRTGRYRDISIEAQPSGSGVELRVVTTFNYFTSGVLIDGVTDPPSLEQLRTATKLELGTLFHEDLMEPAVSNMLERLHANGLYNAQLSYHVDFNPGTEEAGVYFQILPEDRARFDGINLTGTLTEPADSMGRVTGWRRRLLDVPFLILPGWREFTEQRLQSGIGKVESRVQRGNHLAAHVTLDSLQYHPELNLVTPTLRIDSGPALEVNVTGDKISNGRLRQLIPIYQERTVDRSLLIEGQGNLLEYLQSQGYLEARVDYEQLQPQPDRSVIDYNVVRGQRSKLAKIEIAGNGYFDEATLRDRLAMIPASFVRYHWGRFSPRLLERDINVIGDLYHANGFREAKVTSTQNDDYKGKHGNLSLLLEINEGPQWLVHSLVIDGVRTEEDSYFRSILRSIPGEPYSESNIAADRDTILNYYYNDGYVNAAFDWTQSPGALPTEVDVHFVVRPGKQVFVRNIFVRGLRQTRPSLVSRRITLAPRSPISQARIGESQQKLYDLGIFSKVQTALQDPDGDEDSKNVLFLLDEASKYSFNVGFGAELARIGGGVTSFDAPAGATAFSPQVTAGISRLNFLGLAHTISLQSLVSTIEQRVSLTYQAAQFYGHENLTLTFTGLFDDSHDIRTFVAHRLEGSVQLAQKLSRVYTIQYRYTIRRVTVPQDALVSPLLIPIFSKPDRAGLVSMSFVQDRRDDPVNTHRGYLNTLDVGEAWSAFGSATGYTRVVLRNSSYYPLSRDVVLAQTSQFGFISGTPQYIPLAERFYSGGPSTNRAFPDNQAGPRDPTTGFPVGGDAFLFHSTELRFPLIGDDIGGVLFHDIGNVYDSIGDVSLRFSQRNITDFNYAVNSFGFGIRYRTPIGPIRLDFSLGPDSPRFYGYSGTLEQLLAGQKNPVNQRISVFQFHFALGQTF